MRIEGLRKFRGRNPQGYFQDLKWEERQRAYAWLHKFCERWRGNLPQWRLAILIGQAKRLALNPPTSAWGHKMLAKRGGYAVQRRYEAAGRVGKLHPARHAARVSASKRRWKKTVEERKRLGVTPPRSSFNLHGI